MLDGSLGTVEQAEADAEAQQQRQIRQDEPDDDDDDPRLVKDDDAQAMEDVGGFGGGGYTGPGLVGQENTDPEMFSHEAEEEPEVAPNIEPDDYNEDDAAGDLGRSFSEEDREAADDLHESQVDVNYFDDEDTPSGEDETQNLGRAFTDEDREAAENIEVDVNYFDDSDVPSGEDETQNLGRAFTDEDREAAENVETDVNYFDDNDVPSGEDETQNLGRAFTDEDREAAESIEVDVNYFDDNDVPSGEDETQNLGRAFADEDREAAADQNLDVNYTDEDIPLDGFPPQGSRPPDGYHLERLNDGSYVYRRDRPFSAVRDAANDWIDSRPEGQPVPLQTNLYMGEGSPNFYIDESGNLTTAERETAKRWSDFHEKYIEPPVKEGVGDTVNRLLPWEHPLVGNVVGGLAAAGTNPLEHIAGEGLASAIVMREEILRFAWRRVDTH